MSAAKRLLEEIEVVNRRRRIIQKNDSLVVGVSGGPDSMALLALLCRLRRKYALQITAAHVDHGLVRKQSLRQLRIVKSYCPSEKVPLYIRTIHLKKLAKQNKRSIEEMGRIARYSFFESVARRIKADKIVTAHTLDDQAETILLRILRGTGLKGLEGIPVKRKQGDFTVVRPLLRSRKKELLSFLNENRIPYAVDATNRDTAYTRNRVRHLLLPMLEKQFNPQIKESLLSLQAVCAEAADFIDRAAEQAFTRCLMPSASKKRISLKVVLLKRLHPALLHEVLLKALAARKGDAKGFTYAHVSALADILASPEKNLELHLPKIKIKKTSATLNIG